MTKAMKLAAAVLAAVALVSACGGAEANEADTTAQEPAATTTQAPTTTLPATEQISGTFTLFGDFMNSGRLCWGDGGYDDIDVGAQVVVTDGDGSVIGASNLGDGKTANRTSGLWLDCVFKFTVDVPADVPFYSIEVSHRGALTYTNDELAANDWTVAFTLG